MLNSGNATNFDRNPYFTFKLHRYHNIRNNDISLPKLEEFVDEIIPMVECNHKEYEYMNGWDINATIFCPQYRKNDILMGDYYSEKSSWLRLTVHRCDPNDTIKVNGAIQKKKCKSRKEQDKYFKNNILSVFKTMDEPNLQSSGKVPVN